MRSTSKIAKHEFIQPGSLAKERGQSLRVMSSLRINVEQRTLIAKNNSYNTTTSKLNKLTEKSILVHPHFYAMEDNGPIYKEVEVMQDAQRSDARGQGKNIGVIGSLKEASAINSVNRSKLSMSHRTGSKPIREIIYELGGKDGNPLDMATIFLETRWELVQSEPSLTNIDVVKRCFGPQCKSHAVGFGGGITAKELKSGTTSKAALLEELKATRKEKESL
ncbi:hypothetical protein HAX54_037216 [Datura stramonium]|uniref:Uncharacterized protein n=1 Tax=Datura stramonium TaxID=4076 RepID=A0ABS8SGX5_DATST|nr:hypothetical protein [Datura stramonium]